MWHWKFQLETWIKKIIGRVVKHQSRLLKEVVELPLEVFKDPLTPSPTLKLEFILKLALLSVKGCTR